MLDKREISAPCEEFVNTLHGAGANGPLESAKPAVSQGGRAARDNSKYHGKSGGWTPPSSGTERQSQVLARAKRIVGSDDRGVAHRSGIAIGFERRQIVSPAGFAATVKLELGTPQQPYVVFILDVYHLSCVADRKHQGHD